MGYIINFLLGLICAQNAQCWSATSESTKTITEHQATDITTYLGLALCPLRFEPWSCTRTLSARVLDDWNYELNKQWDKLKVEADQQLNTTLQMRGYSLSDGFIKEKPSTMLKKIEIGTQYIKKYLGESMNVSANGENETDDYVDEIDDRDVDAEGDGDEESSENNNEESPNDNHDDHKPTENELTEEETKDVLDGNEFIEIDATSPNGDLKHPSIGGKIKKNKKKKGDQNGQPSTLVVVQASDHTPNSHIDHDEHDVHEDQDKPLKQKRKKNKKKHQHGGGHESNVIAEHDTSNHIGLGFLEELIGDESLSSGGKRKKKGHPSKYGRSNGVTRGKKKKKKKALMKLVLIGSFLKAKIELLLKILGSHLQIKFFAIALIGLLINIARFWIEVKRGGAPQKVVYVEHAHHQHHYEDHGEDWNEQGGYWKRSLQTASGLDEPTSTDAYLPKPQDHPHNLAYRNYWQ